MQLSITHATTYRYTQGVEFNPHRLLLRPRGAHDLRVLEHTLRCAPVAEVTLAQDVFGNLVATAQFGRRAPELSIISQLLVEVTSDPWPVFRIPAHAQTYPFEHSADEVADLGSLRTRPDLNSAVGRWAQGFIRSDPTDTLALLKDLNAGVLASATYRHREEEGVQAGAQTLALASGSCRDFAALFMEAARHLGFGARAVSGYLFDAGTPQRRADTTHAWAEVYLPGAGWIAFDPTHARVGSAGLLPVAVGRGLHQIMPVAGTYVGAPDDLAGMEVRIDIKRIG